jgi:ligand-binding sensor domain-containing protein
MNKTARLSSKTLSKYVFLRISIFLLVFIVTNSIQLHSQLYWQNSYSSSNTNMYCMLNSAYDQILVGRVAGFANNGGVLETEDNGTTWNIIGLKSYDIFSLATDNEGILYAGTYANGVSRSLNRGMVWETIGLPGETINAIAVSSNKYIYAGSYTNGVYRSTNNGIKWDNVGLEQNRIYCLAIDTGGTVFAGTMSGLFTLKKNETTWVRMSSINSTVSSITLDLNNNIFIGTETLGVLYTTNSGKDWITINRGLASLNIKAC